MSDSRTHPSDSAFPGSPSIDFHQGLTKREFIASQIVTGLLARQYGEDSTAVKRAVKIADQLIEELNKEK